MTWLSLSDSLVRWLVVLPVVPSVQIFFFECPEQMLYILVGKRTTPPLDQFYPDTGHRIAPKKNLDGALEMASRIRRGRVLLDVYGPIDDEAYWTRCKSRAGELPSKISFRYHGPSNCHCGRQH